MKVTHTFVELEVSRAAYMEIWEKLAVAGYHHAFIDGAIDMHGIALTKGETMADCVVDGNTMQVVAKAGEMLPEPEFELIPDTLTHIRVERKRNGDLQLFFHVADRLQPDMVIEVPARDISDFFNMWAQAQATLQNANVNPHIQMSEFTINYLDPRLLNMKPTRYR